MYFLFLVYIYFLTRYYGFCKFEILNFFKTSFQLCYPLVLAKSRFSISRVTLKLKGDLYVSIDIWIIILVPWSACSTIVYGVLFQIGTICCFLQWNNAIWKRAQYCKGIRLGNAGYKLGHIVSTTDKHVSVLQRWDFHTAYLNNIYRKS